MKAQEANAATEVDCCTVFIPGVSGTPTAKCPFEKSEFPQDRRRTRAIFFRLMHGPEVIYFVREGRWEGDPYMMISPVSELFNTPCIGKT